MTPNDPRSSLDLSIVIVSWNTCQMLRECLESVLTEFDAERQEIIVVENASDDGSAEMVEQDFPVVRLIRNAKNVGFAAANNQAFEVAQGRMVLLLNSDTLVRGDVIAKSIQYLSDNPDVGGMGCRVLNTDETVQYTCAMFPSLLNLFLELTGLWKLSWSKFLGRYHMTYWQRDSTRPVETISGCYLLVRSEIIETVGNLDESFFFFGEETDWCKRIRDAGWRLDFAPVGTIIHHGGGSANQLNYKRDLMLSACDCAPALQTQWLAFGLCRVADDPGLPCTSGSLLVRGALDLSVQPGQATGDELPETAGCRWNGLATEIDDTLRCSVLIGKGRSLRSLA